MKARQPSLTKSGSLALLFFALLLRTFVPAGFMIAPAAAGTPALVICPDAVAAPAAHDPHHKAHPQPHREHPCPYGALAAPALPPLPPLLPSQPAVRPPLAAALDIALPAPALAAPPPPATGPPASV